MKKFLICLLTVLFFGGCHLSLNKNIKKSMDIEKDKYVIEMWTLYFAVNSKIVPCEKYYKNNSEKCNCIIKRSIYNTKAYYDLEQQIMKIVKKSTKRYRDSLEEEENNKE